MATSPKDTGPSYTVELQDGRKTVIPGAVKCVPDGAGTHLYNEAGEQIAFFYCGQVTMTYPTASAPTSAAPSGEV